MKRSMLLLAVFLSSLTALQAQKLDIIPKPVKIEQKEEVFVIPSSVQIIVDKKNTEKCRLYRKQFFVRGI